ncbi:MAG: hypothetical protein M3177_04515 [Pseudomonadota bacterium]|nr:hypothetical protein [Pseudomonadota bacterium]
MTKTMILGAALVALAGCDYVSLGTGGNENASSDAGLNSGAANAQSAAATPADAGVTTSRSLAGLSGDGGGGKDPAGGVMPAGAQGGIDPAQLIGRWTDDGDCKRDIEFRPDGTFRSYGGGEGSWEVAGDVLTLSGQGGTFRLQLQSVGPDAMVTVNEQGMQGQSTRC